MLWTAGVRKRIVVLSCRARGRRGSSIPRSRGEETGMNRLARLWASSEVDVEPVLEMIAEGDTLPARLVREASNSSAANH